MAQMGSTLAGRRIVVAAHRPARELTTALEVRGARVQTALPLTIVPHLADEQLLGRTRALVGPPPPDVLVVTTAEGFRGWLDAARADGVAPDLLRALAETRVIVLGHRANEAVQEAGLEPEWVADTETASELRDYLTRMCLAGRRVAVQYHGSGAERIDDDLAAFGAEVLPLVVYRWGPPPDPHVVIASLHEIAEARVDAVVFTAAAAAVAYLEAADNAGLRDRFLAACRRQGRTVVAAVGPLTAVPLRQAGLDPVVPQRQRLGELIHELAVTLTGVEVLSAHTRAGELRIAGATVWLDGVVLPMSRTSFVVLRILVRAAGGVVSRRTIAEALPGEANTSHAVDMAVARVRQALGRPDLVETVVKRGYRLACQELS